MNRHERRAAEAQTRHSFEDYSALYRRVYKNASDRAIGKGWMRGAAAEADGINGMILHPPDEPPPSRDACDAQISISYGPQRFVAYTTSASFKLLELAWLEFVEEAYKLDGKPPAPDARSEARGFIFEMLITNKHYVSGELAAVIAGAIVWLARTSPVGIAAGSSHKNIHYEVTDDGPAVPDWAKGKARNFRLMLM